jgi:hypothetical protein
MEFLREIINGKTNETISKIFKITFVSQVQKVFGQNYRVQKLKNHMFKKKKEQITICREFWQQTKRSSEKYTCVFPKEKTENWNEQYTLHNEA